MLSDLKKQELENFKNGLQRDELIWLSGFFAGSAGSNSNSVSSPTPAVATSAVAPVAASDQKTIVLFATQSGNAKKVATKLNDKIASIGGDVELKNVSELKLKNLSNYNNIFVVASTYGEGVPPDTALGFHKDIQSKKAPKLDGINFSVLALGDSSYEKFCQTGKDFDAFFEKLGGNRVHDVVECDVDFDDDANNWIESVSSNISSSAAPVATSTATPVVTSTATPVASNDYSKDTPFKAEVITNHNLNGMDSDKETMHIEISLDDSGMYYQPGDALGVLIENSDKQIEDLVSSAKDKSISDDLKTILKSKEINKISPKIISNIFDIDIDKAKKLSSGNTLKDIIKALKSKISLENISKKLGNIQPRLYSIASSQDFVGDEVHLTVGVNNWENSNGETIPGIASNYIKDLSEGDNINVYLHSNDAFRMPQDSNTPIIMIGAGTGVAPFRSFVQQINENGGEMPSWLFFGERTSDQDFLYQVEWQQFIKDGDLDKVSLAFSRENPNEKVYVQDLIIENSKEFYDWLTKGAHIYVCGDAKRMAKDVNDAIIQVIKENKNISLDDATDELNSYSSIGRYQRDIY